MPFSLSSSEWGAWSVAIASTMPVEKEKLHSKSHNTPFDGAQLYGKVFATIKAGKITYQAEE